MTIQLDSRTDKLDEWPHYEGWKVGNVPEGLTFEVCHSDNGKYSWAEYTYPELCPPRALPGNGVFMFTHNGRRWKVTLYTFNDDIPTHVVVYFEETTQELLPYEELTADEAKDTSHFGGQPTFIQNEVLPCYGNRCAMLLACVESGWGDCGNENIFVAFDDDGIPVGLYHEYSCC